MNFGSLDFNEIIKWLPLIVTFVAGIFALFQIKSNNITNARIKWLEMFKQLLSDFLSESVVIQMKDGVTKGLEKPKQNDVRLKEKSDKLTESYFEHLKNISAKFSLIKMNLNPKEELHRKLEILLDDYMDLFNKIPQTKDEEFSQLLKDLTNSSNKIILLIRFIVKIEWEKTKSINKCIYMKFGEGKKLLMEAMNL